MYTDNIQYTSDSMAYADKRKREVLMLDAKQQILQSLQKGEKPSSLIAEFKCGKATISDIKKNKERILVYISTVETSSGAKKHKTYEEGITRGRGEGDVQL